MPRYAVLAHDWPEPHYDLLLEVDGVLKAWRLTEPPTVDQPMIPNADHRLHYLDYEGSIAGGRGFVTAWDRGVFEWVDETTVQLTGDILSGEWSFVGNRWKSLASSRLGSAQRS